MQGGGLGESSAKPCRAAHVDHVPVKSFKVQGSGLR